MTVSDDPYYDPYDLEIDLDPYPVYRRLREEAPLYRNDRHDFFAVSRADDVERFLEVLPGIVGRVRRALGAEDL